MQRPGIAYIQKREYMIYENIAKLETAPKGPGVVKIIIFEMYNNGEVEFRIPNPYSKDVFDNYKNMWKTQKKKRKNSKHFIFGIEQRREFTLEILSMNKIGKNKKKIDFFKSNNKMATELSKQEITELTWKTLTNTIGHELAYNRQMCTDRRWWFGPKYVDQQCLNERIRKGLHDNTSWAFSNIEHPDEKEIKQMLLDRINNFEAEM